MAKRSEIIRCNCPNCGVGLQIDLDDLNILALGDTAKSPPQKKESEDHGGNDEAGGKENIDGSSGESETDPDPGKDSGKNDSDDWGVSL